MARSNLGRRNAYLALAILCLALTFLFYADEGGMPWMMWRDSPLVAAGLVVLSAVFGLLWWRARGD